MCLHNFHAASIIQNTCGKFDGSYSYTDMKHVHVKINDNYLYVHAYGYSYSHVHINTMVISYVTVSAKTDLIIGTFSTTRKPI